MMAELEFETLDSRYDIARRAERADRFIAGSSEKRIAKTLRGHWESAIDWREIEVRDNLDYLLAGYGLLEIVSAARGDSTWIPKRIRDDALAILGQRQVTIYYEWTYPLVLPQLLRDRLKGELPVAYSGTASGDRADRGEFLVSLLELDRRRIENAELKIFLGLLDGYDYEGWFLDDAMKSLANRSKLDQALRADAGKKPGRSLSRLMTIILGLDAFLTYADELLAMLRRLEGEISGALVWLHHGYFYGESAESLQITFKRVLGLLDRMATGATEGPVARERAARLEDTFEALRNRERWLRPAKEAGLGSYLATLDPARVEG